MWLANSTILSEWKDCGQNTLLWIRGKRQSVSSDCSLELIVSPSHSRRWQERDLVRQPSIFLRVLMTMASSTIIEDIEKMRKAGRASLAIYYHDFREDQKKDLRGLLSSVLVQLCDQSDSYYDILFTFHSAHRDGAQSPSDDDLVRCMTDLMKVSRPIPVYLIVDGLDECPSTSALSSPREEVLSLLETLVESRLPNLRICVTSRPEADIKLVLEPLTFRSISLHDESGQMEDIENYIKSVVNTNRKMQRWTHEHRKLAIDVLTERAGGM
jgi:hypothetical protein